MVTRKSNRKVRLRASFYGSGDILFVCKLFKVIKFVNLLAEVKYLGAAEIKFLLSYCIPSSLYGCEIWPISSIIIK